PARRLRAPPAGPEIVAPLPESRGDQRGRRSVRPGAGREPRGPRGHDRPIPLEAARLRHHLGGVGDRGLLPRTDVALGTDVPRAVSARRAGAPTARATGGRTP